ncbi:leucine-rich repeat-containing protein 27-like isoform X2 [Lineus longissimus]|uniref:leucine-rich repeat-containing protein 27-like isoform X2 n=1 Tax=Lineus longissimus TaxID=88925 RepID=UPI002B4F062E
MSPSDVDEMGCSTRELKMTLNGDAKITDNGIGAGAGVGIGGGIGGGRCSESSNVLDSLVLMLIERCKALGSKTIDLSQRNLMRIPDELLELGELEYLYLEGNNLTCLPEDFFDRLPNLKWLDLRRNYIVGLPSTYIGRHCCLKTLLLEGNELKSLPLELGLVETLTGLNIASNPLEFPSSEIIERGVDHILRYLREMLLTKSEGRTPLSEDCTEEESVQSKSSVDSSPPVPEMNRIAELSIQDGDTSSDESVEDYRLNRNVQDYGYERQEFRSNQLNDRASARSDQALDSVGSLPGHSAALHKPVSYYQIRQQHMEKVTKAGGSGKLNKSKSHSGGSRRSSIKSKKSAQSLSRYPTLPPMEVIEHKAQEEKRLKKIQSLKEKQDAVLQKRKDTEMLKNFQTETRQMQRKKYTQRLRRGEDYEEPATTAPFGIESGDLKMKNNEERIKEDVKSAHEKMRRVMSPASRLRLEEARSQRDRELERKIKTHAQDMTERRKHPKGNPKEEMAAAKREMEIVKILQTELLRRCGDMRQNPTKI